MGVIDVSHRWLWSACERESCECERQVYGEGECENPGQE